MTNVHTTELSDLETTILVNLLLKEAKEYEALAIQMDNVKGGRDSFTYRAAELRVMASKLLSASQMKTTVTATVPVTERDPVDSDTNLPGHDNFQQEQLEALARVMYARKEVKLKHGFTHLPYGVVLELYNASWFRTRDNKGIKDQTAEQLIVRASFPGTEEYVVFNYKELDSLDGVWTTDQVVNPSLLYPVLLWLTHNTEAIAKFYLVRKPKIGDYLELLTSLAHH